MCPVLFINNGQRKYQRMTQIDFRYLLSIEWNSIRLSGPSHGIVTKTVHKTMPGVVGVGGGGGQGGRGWWG